MKHVFFLTSAVVLCLVCCERTELGEPLPCVVISIEAGKMTKASCTENLSDTLVFSAFLATDGTRQDGLRPYPAHGSLCVRREDGLYVPGQKMPPVDFNVFSRARFYLYGPCSVGWISLSGREHEGPPELFVSLPGDPSLHEDVYAGASPEYTADSFYIPSSGRYGCLERADVQMHHIMTCVSVRTDSIGITSVKVKSVTFRGVYSQGTYAFADCAWTGLENTDVDFKTFPDMMLDGTAFQPVLSSGLGTAFMMIPQTLPPGASLELVLETDDGEVSCSIPIDGNVWKAGYHAVYSLHSDKPSGSFDINPFIPGGDQDEIL